LEFQLVNGSFLRVRGGKREEIGGRKVPEIVGSDLFVEPVKSNLDR
jgi:hypothetical protein